MSTDPAGLLAPIRQRIHRATPRGLDWEALTDPGDRHAAPAWVVDADDIEIRLPATYAAGRIADLIANAPKDLTRLLTSVEAVLSICDNDEGTVVTQADGAHVPIYLIRAALAAALESEPDQAPPLPEHDEDICSAGSAMCRECYAAGADFADTAEQGTR